MTPGAEGTPKPARPNSCWEPQRPRERREQEPAATLRGPRCSQRPGVPGIHGAVPRGLVLPGSMTLFPEVVAVSRRSPGATTPLPGGGGAGEGRCWKKDVVPRMPSPLLALAKDPSPGFIPAGLGAAQGRPKCFGCVRAPRAGAGRARPGRDYTMFCEPGSGTCGGPGSGFPCSCASCSTGMLHRGHTFRTSSHLMRHLRTPGTRGDVRGTRLTLMGTCLTSVRTPDIGGDSPDSTGDTPDSTEDNSHQWGHI